MNKEKQIDEMAIAVCPLIEEYKSCEKCDSELDMEDEKCIYKIMSELFVNAGYRKASEIFEEIEKYNRPPLPECEPVYVLRKRELAELKKKYTESEKDNENNS